MEDVSGTIGQTLGTFVQEKLARFQTIWQKESWPHYPCRQSVPDYEEKVTERGPLVTSHFMVPEGEPRGPNQAG